MAEGRKSLIQIKAFPIRLLQAGRMEQSEVMKLIPLLLLTGMLVVSGWAEDDRVPYSPELVKKAELGDAEGQYNLGYALCTGTGVGMDEKKGFEWLTKSAEQGNKNGQYVLGFCYQRGIGVEKDEKEAVRQFTKSAEQGYAQAQYELGVCYINGQGVTQDAEGAVKWLTKAAEQGNAIAQQLLGVFCYKGVVTKDLKEAVKWFRKAAEQGDAIAQCRLGLCYFEGEGVAKDDKEAVKWLTKAAEQGNAEAQYNLGCFYFAGTGVAKDDKEAIKWLTKSAEQGDAKARRALESVEGKIQAAALQKTYVQSGAKNSSFAQFDLSFFQKMLVYGTSQEKVVEIMGSPDQQSTSGGWIYFGKVLDKVTSKSLYLRIMFSGGEVESVQSQ